MRPPPVELRSPVPGRFGAGGRRRRSAKLRAPGRASDRLLAPRPGGLSPQAGPGREGGRRARWLGAAGRTGDADATSDTLEVQMALDPSQQGEVKKGDRARITLPDNTSADRNGRPARAGRPDPLPARGAAPEARPIPAYHRPRPPGTGPGSTRLPSASRSRPGASKNALSVPATAIVGGSGDAFAVEVGATVGHRTWSR